MQMAKIMYRLKYVMRHLRKVDSEIYDPKINTIALHSLAKKGKNYFAYEI